MASSTSGVGTASDWRVALGRALIGQRGSRPDLVLVFVSHHFDTHYRDIIGMIQAELEPRAIAGCSGQGVIGRGVELEDEPALSLMCLRLPGAEFRKLRLRHEDVFSAMTAAAWHRRLGLATDQVNALLVFSDPFTFDTEALVTALGDAYPGVPVVGGMASGSPRRRAAALFSDGQVLESGAVVLALCGAWTVRAVVSQGATPIGETWTVTAAERNLVATLGGRPTLQVIAETMRALPPEMQQRAARNLLVGLAMDEYRDTFGRGDFLIRNLLGADQQSGIVAVGALVRPGQTLQFQVRDAAAADEELATLLAGAAQDLGPIAPAGALLCSCNGRGTGLFGAPNHDAAALEERFAALPIAGFFCNGEIGPVGGKAFVHGFTASMALFVPA